MEKYNIIFYKFIFLILNQFIKKIKNKVKEGFSPPPIVQSIKDG
jgi:hypothetical protein